MPNDRPTAPLQIGGIRQLLLRGLLAPDGTARPRWSPSVQRSRPRLRQWCSHLVEVANANEPLVLDGPEAFVFHSELALLKLAECAHATFLASSQRPRPIRVLHSCLAVLVRPELFDRHDLLVRNHRSLLACRVMNSAMLAGEGKPLIRRSLKQPHTSCVNILLLMNF